MRMNIVSFYSQRFPQVRFTVQVPDRSKRLSKQRAADIVDKQYDDDIRRSVKKSNLTRQQEFKKLKKHQKKSGTFPIFIFPLRKLYSIRKNNGQFEQCTRFDHSSHTKIINE